MAASTELSTLNVTAAIQRLSIEKTRELVFRLGVQDYVLDNIDIQYGGITRTIKYVEVWLDRDTEASWEKLVSSLKCIGKNVLAEEVEAVYSQGEEASVPSTSSAPLASATPTPMQSLGTLAQLETTPLPPTVTMTTATVKPPVPALQSPAVSMERVAEVKAEIEKFEEEFSNIKSDTRAFLSDKESQDAKFLARFRDHLLDLPVSRRAIHARFFYKNEDEIFNSKTIERIFAILRRYCNYSNYDIILHLVKKFCNMSLKKRMEIYRVSFESFEVTTTVDIYLCAVSAHPQGEVYQAFSKMIMTIDKPASECTLHEIRQLKESLAESADIHSYSAYIESVGTSSVLVVLRIPQSCVVWVGRAVTSTFMQEHRLVKVSIDGRDITYYQDKEYLVCYLNNQSKYFRQ